ncbi:MULTISPECIES: hypothetical protein [Methylobacterium]|uniref:Uncharacterized protein n=1 Tax=Methylobacterium jeotgali TaxID=381630 RepID=A0ABQ4SYC5_9HYPH|nr:MULTISPECIES: hypothetical protein [Methylobacterium]PIU06267.1 MAG: hypothetical protein COT56_10635 [Methylobacterium sp. CG09_land_8_20_14_0_10_71_15]PIU11182.1 MAG: hypothetical protein COT28_21460 [Methylobacterium sp. CG08_land_8_20_14_0_20_71_15]GBU18968.1 hypothetical protein AwMethylo_31830 [Methylobacterium sp.]GJE07534.1 hypothetical protein AOPFMNJM_2863 [Methylobacterium jeotgali]
MPHLAQDLLSADPDALARLRTLLHGETPPASAPDPAERFGAAAGLPMSDAAPAPKPTTRRPRRRRALVTP